MVVLSVRKCALQIQPSPRKEAWKLWSAQASACKYGICFTNVSQPGGDKFGHTRFLDGRLVDLGGEPNRLLA